MSAPQEISFSAATDVGRKRKHNEDNYLVDPELGLYVVADGMGGHAAGEVASALAVRTIHEVLLEHAPALRESLEGEGGPTERRLQRVLGLLEVAVNAASMKIHTESLADTSKRGMGTTVSLLLIRGSHGFVAHVGDSRIYLHRDGEVRQVTDDHTVAKELIRLGMITPAQVHTIPKKNAITRAVGVYPHVQVDTLSFEVLPNDGLLLCSDGLAGYVDDIDEPLAPYFSNDDLDGATQELLAFANAAGGKDNITAVLVRLGGDEADGHRARRIALKREVLDRLPLFARLNERQRLGIMSFAEVHAFPAGHVVVREGEQGDGMYVVLEGKLDITRGATSLGELGPGEQFGEMALIRANPRSATITTLVDSELVLLRRDDFFDFVRNDPSGAVKLLWQFINVLADRLDHTSEELRLSRLGSLEEGVSSSTRGPETTPKPSADPFSMPSRAPYSLSRAPADSAADEAEPPPSVELPHPPSSDADEEERPTRTYQVPTGSTKATLPVRRTPVPPPPLSTEGLTPEEPPPPLPTTKRRQQPTNPGSPIAMRRSATPVPVEPAPETKVAAAPPEFAESKRERGDADIRVVGARSSDPRDKYLHETMPSSLEGLEGGKAEGEAPEFQPTKQTVRIGVDDESRETLEQMRREFRERLAAERAKSPDGEPEQ